MHSFTTERLLIRLLIPEDEDFYAYQYTDPKMMRIIGTPLSEKEARAAFHRALKANSGEKKTVMTWAIVDKASNEIIGTQALSWLAPKHQVKPSNQPITQVEIGIMLATKANGKLLPDESTAGVMEYGFKYLNIDRVNAFYSRINRATKRILDKLGYVLDEALQDPEGNVRYQYAERENWQQSVITKVIN